MVNDFKNFKDKSPSKSSFAVLLNPCFYSVLLYRVSHFFYKIKLTPLAKVIWFINRIVFCVDIDYRAIIGKRFRLIHGIGVVIGYDVVIGDDVDIYQGVTIGGSGKIRVINGIVKSQPIIKNGVKIYTNACLFGPLIIEDNEIIKACKVIAF
ncbi:serine O-acetyltransferase [Clostridium perfringens]|uniref:serine O-acetyltransferase n=1 Tax=Clostridium perfringens TaxID=1502 RepID=UPI0018E47403|nr:hypothetical protein [Clostridium perfringens]MBI6066233.1 serine acetyltransferase [Clostridium perfringens]MDK0606747.1 hypothetical protein [Clostridium perfringens]MDZ5031026.1 serine acetyltransferase [Clostridium perfringens]